VEFSCPGVSSDDYDLFMHPILCVRFERSDTGTLHLYTIILSPELRTREESLKQYHSFPYI
jgi:hypothetical protein